MRTSQQLADGVVGEVMFPNTIPPFFPSFVLSAPPPKDDEYEHRLAGIRAHNRWLADFCADYPAQRAGIGQIFTHDLDDAMADVQWVAEHGLRGGILHPEQPARRDLGRAPALRPVLGTALGALRRSRRPGQRARRHRRPELRQGAGGAALFIAEFAYFAQRPFLHLLMSGVFERHPKLTFVMTEMGAYWLPPLLRRLDLSIARIRDTGATGELRYGDESILPKVPASTSSRTATSASRRRRPPTSKRCWRSGSTGSCGVPTTRTTRARSRSRGNTCDSCSPTGPRTTCGASSPATRPRLRLRPRRAGTACGAVGSDGRRDQQAARRPARGRERGARPRPGRLSAPIRPGWAG